MDVLSMNSIPISVILFMNISNFFEEVFTFFLNNYWIRTLAISLLVISVSLLIYISIFFILKQLEKKSDLLPVKKLREKFKTPGLYILLSLACLVIVSIISSEDQIFKYITHFLHLLIIFGFSWLLIRLIKVGKDIVLRNYDINQKDNLRARQIYTQFKIIERILIFIVVIIAIAVGLMTFEGIRKIGISIFASAGVIGIILGFAAQKLIGTVLAGFQIAITQPIRLDDVVIVENEWGRIEEITLTYVVVRIWDQRRLIVPTTYFIEHPFQNWTRISSEILGTVFIYTDYTVPIDKLREELTRILKSDKNWDGRVNVMQLTNSTEKTIEIRALMSAIDSSSAWDLRVNVREKLISFLQQNYPGSLPRTRLTLEDNSLKTPGQTEGNLP